jgi:hypothetical protein
MTDQSVERAEGIEYCIARTSLSLNCSAFVSHQSIAEDIPDVPILLWIQLINN